MSMYLDLIEQFSQKIIQQLFLISSNEKGDQSFQDNSEKLIENLRGVLNKLNEEKGENIKLEDEVRDLDTNLFKLQIQYEELNKNIQNLKKKTNEIILEIENLEKTYNKIDNELLESNKELQEYKLELAKVVSNISAKESEKEVLEQKKKNNEDKQKQVLTIHSKNLEEFKIENEKKVKELDSMNLKKIEDSKKDCSNKILEMEDEFTEFKSNNFFTLFLIENSDDKIPEFEIILKLIESQIYNLDDLKNQIELPPILALRIIKQMQAKDILKIDEEYNTVSLSESLKQI
ncbi:MAG: hypothetical protein ACFE8E_06330 [Candidatus Hodarchaeota archaeon]